MSDWTPTTEVIRHAVTYRRERLGEPRPIKPEAFDRWLEQVKAEAWDAALDDAYRVASATAARTQSIDAILVSLAPRRQEDR